MKTQRTIFKWIGVLVLLSMSLSFAIVSPSVSAQEDIPPIATETPTEISTEETSYPTITPAPTIVEPLTQLQSMEQSSASSDTEWPEFNISQTDLVSEDPSIATDATGGLHIVWAEMETSGKTDMHSDYPTELKKELLLKR